MMDEDHNGILTLQEIKAKIKRERVSDEVLDEVHKVLDRNSDGSVTL